MSAIEHPAARSGKITFCSGAVRMSADSAMKCTPQNTMNSASGRAAASRASLNEIAGDVGELDDLVALIVMAEHEQPLAQRGLGPPGSLDKSRVGGWRQIARTLDAPLGSRVGLPPENEERQRRSGPECRCGSGSHPTNVLSACCLTAASLAMAPATPTRRRQASMRMLVATDAMGALSSRQAGELIASGWRPTADVSVLPVGEAGGAFVAAYADLARREDLDSSWSTAHRDVWRGVKHRAGSGHSAPIRGSRESRSDRRPGRSGGHRRCLSARKRRRNSS